MMANWGLDTATNCESEAACIASTLVNGNKTTFVMRYYSNYSGKNLTRNEALALSQNGVRVRTIWENSNAPSYFTYDQGVLDGEAAFKYAANVIIQHQYTPVYFAVDFDATSTYQSAIASYFSGVHQGYVNYVEYQKRLGLPIYTYDIGVYGSYWVLGWCQSQGITTYYYQANATGWSGGENANQWPSDNIWQNPETSVCGILVDQDIAWGNEGAWLA